MIIGLSMEKELTIINGNELTGLKKIVKIIVYYKKYSHIQNNKKGKELGGIRK